MKRISAKNKIEQQQERNADKIKKHHSHLENYEYLDIQSADNFDVKHDIGKRHI